MPRMTFSDVTCSAFLFSIVAALQFCKLFHGQGCTRFHTICFSSSSKLYMPMTLLNEDKTVGHFGFILSP